MHMKQIILILSEIQSLLELNKEVLTLQQYAKYAGISIQTAYKQTSQRRLPFYRQGKHLYLKREDVIAFLLSHPVKSNSDIEKDAMKHLQ